jgi:hypothetical protein
MLPGSFTAILDRDAYCLNFFMQQDCSSMRQLLGCVTTTGDPIVLLARTRDNLDPEGNPLLDRNHRVPELPPLSTPRRPQQDYNSSLRLGPDALVPVKNNMRIIRPVYEVHCLPVGLQIVPCSEGFQRTGCCVCCDSIETIFIE